MVRALSAVVAKMEPKCNSVVNNSEIHLKQVKARMISSFVNLGVALLVVILALLPIRFNIPPIIKEGGIAFLIGSFLLISGAIIAILHKLMLGKLCRGNLIRIVTGIVILGVWFFTTRQK